MLKFLFGTLRVKDDMIKIVIHVVICEPAYCISSHV